MQDSYITHSKTTKTLFRKIKADLSKGKEIPHLQIRQFHFVKISVLSKLFYRLNATQIPILTGNSQDDNKFIQKYKGLRIAKVVLKKKNKAEVHTFLDIKTYYKVAAIKTVQH